MALTLKSLEHALGLGVGAATGGGAGTLTAVGAQQQIEAKLEATISRAGQRIGAYTGPGLFRSLAQGSAQGSQEATSGLVKQTLASEPWEFWAGAAILAAGAIWLIFFRR